MAEEEIPVTDVVDRAERSRYELPTPSGPAILAYERDGDRLILTHTVVPSQQEGHGVGTRLIAAVLDDVRRQGAKVVPACPFVSAYIQRHPDVSDLVAES